MANRDEQNELDTVMSTGAARIPSWIPSAQGRPFRFATVYILALIGGLGFLTPIPAVVAFVMSVRAAVRGAPGAKVAVAISLIAIAIGTWLFLRWPFG